MTPLQKIAMGMLIVVLPAYFPRDPRPPWQVYDALPDPVGWALALVGLWALRRAFDLDLARMLAALALLVSIPLWLPQVNHLLVPKYNPDLPVSFAWFLSLPQSLFGFFLCRSISAEAATQQPRDQFVAGRFGLLGWGFGAAVILPVVAYGGGLGALQAPTLLLVGLVDVVFVYYLFRVHRRTWLGGPGPLEIRPTRAAPGPATPDSTKAAPDEPGRPA